MGVFAVLEAAGTVAATAAAFAGQWNQRGAAAEWQWANSAVPKTLMTARPG